MKRAEGPQECAAKPAKKERVSNMFQEKDVHDASCAPWWSFWSDPPDAKRDFSKDMISWVPPISG